MGPAYGSIGGVLASHTQGFQFQSPEPTQKQAL